MALQRSSVLTPREYELQQYEKEMTEKAYAHSLEVKRLDIEAQKLEAKITSWFKIPLAVIRLPFYVLLIIPLSIYAARKHEVPPEYWRLLK